MEQALSHIRDAAILSAVRVHRIISFRDLWERFFTGGDRSTAYKRIHVILSRYSHIVEEWRMNGCRELFVRAKPAPGVAGSYDEHDLAVSRIVQALNGLFGPDLWRREIELRSGSLGPRFEILSKNLASRIPDAAWSFGQTYTQIAALEYERTLKSAKRIRGIVSHYEDRIECKFTSAFVVTDDPLIARAYEDSIRAFYSKVRFQIRPKSRVILLDEGWQRSASLLVPNMNRLRNAVRSEIESAASAAAGKGIQEHGKVA